MSVVEPVKADIGVRHPREPVAVWFRITHTYNKARSQVFAGHPEQSMMRLVLRLTSWYLHSAGFWCCW
jgi:hypothetical protein